MRGKYTLLHTTIDPSAQNHLIDEPDTKRPKLEDEAPLVCTLPTEVQTLMSLIFDRGAVERTVAKYQCQSPSSNKGGIVDHSADRVLMTR